MVEITGVPRVFLLNGFGGEVILVILLYYSDYMLRVKWNKAEMMRFPTIFVLNGSNGKAIIIVID